MWSTLWLVVSSLLAVRANQCKQDPEKMKIIEGMLVKDNPTHLIADVQFSDVWASNVLTGPCQCSYVKYTKKEGGCMEDKTVCRLKTGEEKDAIKEFLRETEKPGVYSLDGVYDISESGLTALAYIIHADSSTIAFFTCEVVGTNWFVGVQVRSDVREKLSSKEGDNEVKQSLAKAQQKMLQAKQLFTLPKGRDFLMFDLDNLC